MFKEQKVLCIVCSAGGHLTEALLAVGKLDYPKYLVTYKLPHITGNLTIDEVYFITNPHKSMHVFLINFFQSLKLYMRKRPKFILSTGSGMAIATCIIGKFFGSKIIFVETGARVREPSLTGRFMYRFSDLFIVQWEPLLRHFPKATFGGLLM